MVCKTIDVNGWNLFQHVELFVRKIKLWRYLSFVFVTRSPNNKKIQKTNSQLNITTAKISAFATALTTITNKQQKTQ